MGRRWLSRLAGQRTRGRRWPLQPALHYRVLNIYEKYYNKWFMSKLPYKVWKKEPKPYKLKIRLLNKDALQEYRDADFYGGAFEKNDTCRIIGDSLILDVVGKLQGS